MLRFTTGSNDNKAGKVWTLDPATGAPVLIGDTFKHEKKENPDGDVAYGFLNTPESCLDKLPEYIPASYPGPKESHPYATATAAGVTYVADAGANAVLAISATGVVSTVALIPPAKVKVTADGAEANGLPGCTVGKKLRVRERAHRHRGRRGRLPLRDQPPGRSGGRLPGRQRPPPQGQARRTARCRRSPAA